MKYLHIDNSYKTWSKSKMRTLIEERCFAEYETTDAEATLHRTYHSLYIEWWLHNIAYYLTKPFCFSEKILFLNLRAKDVDLEEH